MPPVKLISMHLIDEPEVAMRSEMDDSRLRSLADDIARIGLTNAIAVTRTGERYQIAAGHRRYIACRMLGRYEIECKDYTGTGIDPEAIKFSENTYRDEISDADMAIWLSDIQAKYHYDLERLQALTGKSEDWIAKRLSLFAGDKAVFDALRVGQIKLGHAIELNKFPDQFRAQYLLQVVASTPPVRIVEQWRLELRAMNLPALPQAEEAGGTASDVPLPGVVVDACRVCNGNSMPWAMEYVRVHTHCWEMIKKAMEQSGV